MKQPRKALRLATIFYINFAFSALLALALYALTSELTTSLICFATVFLAVPLIVLFSLGPVIVHELGHFFAARRNGLAVGAFAIGPFEWHQATGKWREADAYVQKRFAGYVFAYPTDTDRVVERYYKMILGGPVANLIFAAGLLLIYTIIRLSTTPGQKWVEPILLYVVSSLFLHVLIAVFSLIPRQIHGTDNDGRRLQLLRRGGSAAERQVALLVIAGCITRGIKAEDWPGHLIPLLKDQEDKSITSVQCQYFASFWTEAQGDYEGARTERQEALRLAESLDQRYPVLEAAIQVDLAFLLLNRFDNLEEAKQIMQCLADPLKNGRGWVTRVEALIALKSGNPGEAMRLSLQAKHELETETRMIDTPVYQTAIQGLNDIIDQAQEAQGVASSNRTPE